MNKSLCSLRLFIVTVLAFMVVVGLLNSPTQAERSLQQPTSGEKTTEQVQKNIQVLTGLPQSQLIPVMNFISSSLGVRCTFCHVNNSGTWDFASDVKPEKATAREMIKMVNNLNKVNFRGANEVSCYTCHRGRSRPQSVPALPVPEPPRPPGAAAAPTAPSAPSVPSASPAASPAPAANPTADEVLAKYQTAMGGPAAIQRLKTVSMKGSWLTSNGVTIPYEVYQSGLDKLYTSLNTPRQGMFERGFDGAVGWELSGRGVRDIAGEELIFLRRYPNYFADTNLKNQFTALAFASKEEIDDRPVIVLRGTNTAGKRERLFFDAETGLLLRRMSFTPTVVGVIPEQVDYEDYRDVEGMKLPFKIRISSVDPNSSSTRQFTEIKLNGPVDESKFKKPAPKPAAMPAP